MRFFSQSEASTKNQTYPGLITFLYSYKQPISLSPSLVLLVPLLPLLRLVIWRFTDFSHFVVIQLIENVEHAEALIRLKGPK